MRIHLLFITILTVALFSAIDTNAQSTMYPESQPMEKGDPFTIERIIDDWVHCDGETKDGGKVYRGGLQGGEPASQPSVLGDNCEQMQINGTYDYYYGDIVGNGYRRRYSKSASYIINQDNNLLVTLGNGDQLLILTDQLMEGILIVREVTK
ncbi:MAG: Unknown protein [uncultured Aureispira sp.]|uniref:Lipocalin-like domain-containing protein n=1 Tax=uncultured Aureispira sp. TaxID=1331704 RepID=A0A6S6UCE6_9BACT|nr:MAG: Unknown protein [uncultured Aureispira sp.]